MARRRNEYERPSIAHFLTRPFKVFWKWGSGLASDDSIRDRQSNPVVSFLLSPLRLLFAWILFLINSWAFSRHVRPFLFGIPALAAVAGVAGVVWLDYFRFPNRVAKTHKYYENFLMDPDRGAKIARHFALKKVSLQPDNLEAKFDLASTWDAIASMPPDDMIAAEQYLAGYRAEDLMNSLVDKDHTMAHVWFARRYLSGREIDLTAEERSAKIDQHLTKALELEPENNAAKIAKADHFLAQATQFKEGSAEYRELLFKASEQLNQVSDSETGEIIWHLPKLMKVLFDLGDTERAGRVYQSSKKMLEQFIRKFPADDRIPNIWIVLIGSAIQLKDYKGAAELIDAGKRQTNDARVSKLFDELSAQLLIRQVDDLKDLDSPEKFQQAFAILSQALVTTPTNIPVSNRIVQFIVPEKSGDKVYVEQLEKLEQTSPSHLLLGIHDVMNGNALAATTHWYVATQQAANSEIILFSMIRSLMNKDQFKNRRDVIALAIEFFPNQGLFYFLRGSDMYNEGNFAEAVVDLEQSAKMIKEPANFEIHVLLARCFKAMKDQTNFDSQRRTLQKMVQLADPGRREILEDYLSQLDE